MDSDSHDEEEESYIYNSLFSNFDKTLSALISLNHDKDSNTSIKHSLIIADLQNKCNTFLQNFDMVFNSNDQDEIVKFLKYFRQNFIKKTNSESNIIFNEHIFEIDDVIEKLISILILLDIAEQVHIFINIILCLKRIIKVYHLFSKSECIEKLNSLFSCIYSVSLNHDMLYHLLNFFAYYYLYYYEKIPNFFDQCFLPPILKDDQLLLRFLPSKQNKIYEKNPVLFIYKIFVKREIRIKKQKFSSQLQNIFNYLSNYICECQQLLIPMNTIFDNIDDNYTDIEEISNMNCLVETHISHCIHIYLIAIDHYGRSFFDLYNHQAFPQYFLFFLPKSESTNLLYAAVDFIYICSVKKCCITEFFDASIYFSLINLLKHHDSDLRIEMANTIYNIINNDNNTIHSFLEGGITKSNIFPDPIQEHLEYNSSNEIFDEIFADIKLVHTIINFYPAHSLYNFDISKTIKYYLDFLERGNDDLTYEILQIFIKMYDHLLKLGENKIQLFISPFITYNGTEIVFEFVEGDEYCDSRNYALARQLLSFFPDYINR